MAELDVEVGRGSTCNGSFSACGSRPFIVAGLHACAYHPRNASFRVHHRVSTHAVSGYLYTHEMRVTSASKGQGGNSGAIAVVLHTYMYRSSGLACARPYISPAAPGSSAGLSPHDVGGSTCHWAHKTRGLRGTGASTLDTRHVTP
jgi:hypothetical protein